MRSQFVTKTGVIAATVGSAVGLGNIWRFPYETGVHGGGAFLLVYILCVLLIGIPVMVAEFAMGRGTHKNALGTFKELTPHSPLRCTAYIGIVASMLILSFYSVVAGWIMEYLYVSVIDLFSPIESGGYAERFATFTTDSWRPSLWTLLFLTVNLLVLRRGIEKGIEKVSNILMPLLFLLLVVLCINSLTLDKAKEGLDFLFKPDIHAITPKVVIGAMGQAFFSLSLGLTCLMTYASYFSDKTSLVRTATITAMLDLLVAILAGVLIFPAVFSYGMAPTQGPKLVFEVLPEIFSQMPGGRLWSVALFMLLFFASITSTISMSEISTAYFIEERGYTRMKSVWINTGVAAVFGVLCALSFGPLSEMTIMGMTIFNLFDYVSSNILLPIGGFMISLAVGWVVDKKFLEKQLSTPSGGNPWVHKCIHLCIRYIAPVSIVIIFIYGLI